MQISAQKRPTVRVYKDRKASTTKPYPPIQLYRLLLRARPRKVVRLKILRPLCTHMEPESVRTYKGLLLPGLGFISDEFSWEEEEISNSVRTNKNI